MLDVEGKGAWIKDMGRGEGTCTVESSDEMLRYSETHEMLDVEVKGGRIKGIGGGEGYRRGGKAG